MDIWVVVLAVQSVGPELESRHPRKNQMGPHMGPQERTAGAHWPLP